MKKIYLMMVAAVVALAFQSCTTVTSTQTYKTNPTDLVSYELVGETEISVNYFTIAYIFRKVDKANGVRYEKDGKKAIPAGMPRMTPLSAAYPELLKKFPEADYFRIVRTTKTVERLFLGTENETKAVVRAYKYVHQPNVPTTMVLKQ